MTPVPMDHHEKMRLRAAAFRVTRLYPGPVVSCSPGSC